MSRTIAVLAMAVTLYALRLGAGVHAEEYLSGIEWAEPKVINPGQPGGQGKDANISD